MAAAVDRRVARLEEELAATKNEAERAAVDYQQAAKVIQSKFQAILSERNRILVEKDLFKSEKNSFQEELTALKRKVESLECGEAHQSLALEKKDAEVKTLHAEKRALDKCLEGQQLEFAELERRLSAAQSSVTALREANTKLDAASIEANSGKHRTEGEIVELSQKNENLKRNIQWLEQQNQDLQQTLQSAQEKAQKEIAAKDLRHAKDQQDIQSLEATGLNLKNELDVTVRELQAKVEDLEAEQKKVSSDNHELEGQLANAQKLVALYKTNGEKRTAESLELQEVVRELRTHIEQMTGAHKDTVSKLEEALSESEKRLAEEKLQAKSVLQAASTGRFLTASQPATPSSQGNGTGERESALLPANAAQMTRAELFAKLSQATAEVAALREAHRLNERTLEEVVEGMETRGAAIREMEVNNQRIQEAYSSMLASLEQAREDTRHAKAQTLDLEAQVRGSNKTIRILQQQVKDCGRQIVILLNEQERLTGRAVNGSQPLSLRSAAFGSPTNGFGGASDSRALVPVTPERQIMKASDVISSVSTFKNLQELQEKNERQQFLIRDLSEELEDSAARLRSELEGEKEAIAQKLEQEIADSRRQREEQIAIVQKIAEQRDLYRKLLQDAGYDPRRAGRSPEVGLLQEPGPLSNGKQVPDETSLMEQMRQNQKDLQSKLEDVMENARLLREELSQAKSDASFARTEAARSQASIAFEKQSAERLTQKLAEQNRQLDQANAYIAKDQEIMASLQVRLSSTTAQIQASENETNMARHKARELQADKTHLERQIENIRAELKQEVTVRCRLEAESRASHAHEREQQSQYADELQSLKKKLTQAELAKSLAEDKLQDAEQRLKEVLARRSVDKQEASARVQVAESQAKEARKAESEALQHVAEMKGKIEVLEKDRLQDLNVQQASPVVGDAQPAPAQNAQLQKISLLESELKKVCEKLAYAERTAAQFEEIAHSNDAALTALLVEADNIRKNAENICEQQKMEVRDILEEYRGKDQEKLSQEQQLRTEIGRQAQALAEKERDAKGAQERHAELEKQITGLEGNIAFFRERFNQAETRCQTEVLAHADTVTQLRNSEEARDILQKTYDTIVQERDRLESQLEEAKWISKAKVSEAEKVVKEAEEKVCAVTEQNEKLHSHLEQRTTQGAGGSELEGVVSYLRHQRDVVDIEKQMAESKATQLETEAAVLRTTVDAMKRQLASQEARRSQADVEQALFDAQKKYQADLSIIRESNVSLRSRITSIQEERNDLKARLDAAEALLQPQKQTIAQLQADVTSLEEEVKMRADQAEKWEKRSNQLRQKYGTIDLEEYKKVEAELAELRKTSVQKSELQKARQRIKELEAQANTNVSRKHHESLVKQFESQIQTLNTSVESEKEQTASLNNEIDTLKKEIASRDAEVTEAKTREYKVKRLLNTYNPQKLPLPDFRARAEEASTGLRLANELTSVMKAFIEAEPSASHLEQKLRSDQTQIRELQSQIQALQDGVTEVTEIQQRLQDSHQHSQGLQRSLEHAELAVREVENKLAASEAARQNLTHRVSQMQATINKFQLDHTMKDVVPPPIVTDTPEMQATETVKVGQAGANEQSDLGGPLPIEPLASPSEAAELAPVISLDGSAPPDPRSLPLPVASLPESGLLDLPPPETLQPLMAPATQPAGSPAEPLGVADKALPLQLSVPPQAVATGVEAQGIVAPPAVETLLEDEDKPSLIPSTLPLADVQTNEEMPQDGSIQMEDDQAEVEDQDSLKPNEIDTQLGDQAPDMMPFPIEEAHAKDEGANSPKKAEALVTGDMEASQPSIGADVSVIEDEVPSTLPDSTEPSSKIPEPGTPTSQQPPKEEIVVQPEEEVNLQSQAPASEKPVAESTSTVQPSTDFTLNPNAPSFQSDNDMAAKLRQQLLEAQKQTKPEVSHTQQQEAKPVSVKRSHTPIPIPTFKSSAVTKAGEGVGGARQAAADAAIKRQQDSSPGVALYQPPAKRARGPASLRTNPEPVASSGGPSSGPEDVDLNESDPLDTLEADDDVADDAQSSGSDDGLEIGEDKEGEREAEEKGDQDMPSVPASPAKTPDLEDPTQPGLQQPSAKPHGDKAGADGETEDGDQENREGEQSSSKPRKGKKQLIIWEGKDGSKGEKKEDTGPAPGRGTSARGRGRRGGRLAKKSQNP